MYFFFSVYFRYIDLVHGSCDHLTYIVLIFFTYWCMFFTYPFMCCFFSFFMHMPLIYIVCNLLILFHTKMPWWVLFKVFQKYRLSKSFLPWTLFLQSFSRVCVRIRFYCIQQMSMSWVIYDFSHMIICLLWFRHILPKGEIVRTYVNHVRNICYLDLANFLTKRTLLVIG